jgi:hypothetical protein
MTNRRTTSLAFAALLVLGAETQAGPGGPPRDIKYRQSATNTNPIAPHDGGAANVYPVLPQSAAMGRIGRRTGDKKLLVVQGEDLLAGDGEVTRERFTVAGAFAYELELAVETRGVELTPRVRAAVADALVQVSRQAVNVRRVRVEPRTIVLETDAGSRSFALQEDGATSDRG